MYDRGDIIFVDFDPTKGREQKGYRPAIVMSNRIFNDATDFAWVSPITSKIKGYPFEVELPDGLATNGVVLSDQLTTLDLRARKTKKQDTAPQELIDQVDTLQKKIHS